MVWYGMISYDMVWFGMVHVCMQIETKSKKLIELGVGADEEELFQMCSFEGKKATSLMKRNHESRRTRFSSTPLKNPNEVSEDTRGIKQIKKK